MALSCSEIRSRLPDYAGRELPPEQRRLVDEHLLKCEDCRHELALHSAIISGLETQPVLTPAAGFTARVMTALPKRRARLVSPWWSLLLLPILTGLAYLGRAPVLAEVARLAGRFHVDRLAMPGVGYPQLTIAAVVIVGLGLLTTAGAAVVGWMFYSDRL